MRCCDRCLCRNLLVTSAAGANWFNAKFVAPVLPAIIRDHLQFRWGTPDTLPEVLELECWKRKFEDSQS